MIELVDTLARVASAIAAGMGITLLLSWAARGIKLRRDE